VGVLLPATGALHRGTAFQLSGRIPFGLGATLPLGELAMLGAVVIVPGVVTGLLLAWLVRTPFKLGMPYPPRLKGLSTPKKVFVVALYVLLLLLVLYVAIVFLSQSFRMASQGINGLIGFALGTGVIFWASRTGRLTDTIPVSRLIPVVLAVTLVTAFGASIGPTTAGTTLARVEFTPDKGLTGGVYSILGEDDSTTWLLSCIAGAAPVRVRSTDIISMTGRAVRFPSTIANHGRRTPPRTRARLRAAVPVSGGYCLVTRPSRLRPGWRRLRTTSASSKM